MVNCLLAFSRGPPDDIYRGNFSHPETGYYIAPLLILTSLQLQLNPTLLLLHLLLNPISQTLFHQHEGTGFRDIGISQRSTAMPLSGFAPLSAHTQVHVYSAPIDTWVSLMFPHRNPGMCPVWEVQN